MSAFLTNVERKLMSEGFEALSLQEKNTLIMTLADKEGLMYGEISLDYILEHHKKIKGEMFSEKCDETITTGFVSSNGHTYRTNRDDQANMIGKMTQLLYDKTITEVNWKTEDSNYIKHTREEWIEQVFIEGLNHKESTLYKYNTKKYLLENAQTDAEVVSVVWE